MEKKKNTGFFNSPPRGKKGNYPLGLPLEKKQRANGPPKKKNQAKNSPVGFFILKKLRKKKI